jgi:hypothetical protein
MTNILPFKRPDPSSKSIEDFIGWLQFLETHAKIAVKRIAGARSTDKVLGYYAEWLRRYYEANGAVASLWTNIDDHVRVHGREVDVDRLDNVVDRITGIEKIIKGPFPWISLPSFDRAKRTASTSLTTVLGEIRGSIGVCKQLVPSPGSPDQGRSA